MDTPGIQEIKKQAILFKSLAGNPKFWLVLLTDIALLIIAHCLAYVIRFADAIMGSSPFNYLAMSTILSLTGLLVCVKIPIFYSVGLYRGMWRYTSYSDILNILKGTIYSGALVIIAMLFINRFQGYSRSIFLIDSILTFLLLSGHRVSIRYFYKNVEGPRQFFRSPQKERKKRILLVGAGSAADKVLREVHDNTKLPYTVVGLVDDDPRKTGLKIHGVPVVGLVEDLDEHIARTRAEETLITISAISGAAMQRLVGICQETGVPFKVLPGIGQLMDGRVSIKAIRDISYADLLGREEVCLEQDMIGSYLHGAIVLVTGAGGSIGSELTRQILCFAPQKLILFDSGEENLYTIENELQQEHKADNLVTILGKVQDQGLLEYTFKKYKPTVVFHAAAYKHVPLVETNPWQAIHNNVFAAQLLIETSIVHEVQRFVLVSTDKAVRPTNVMGASKRLTELLMIAYNQKNWDGSFCPARRRLGEHAGKCPDTHTTIFMAVRFGNVLGSSGSVIPLFKRQIQRGGPVTVTHPEVTRYFMSIEEAAQLILQAGAMGKGGEIFVLKMGEPIKIVQMAKDLIKLAGREPDTEIEIQYTGLRPGEKLYEELITEGEGIVETNHEKIMVLQGNGLTCAELGSCLELLHQKSKAHDSEGIKAILQKLIPEYHPEQTRN
ncbi:polysaccharide biosynthesis protein [Candidatus Electrothrix sp.]|uniref:polysaccharide biosynthesis protein n=2 Tax=Candidatus Electrothrix sp. TaxID=2170559 RepID=UPI00405669E4